MNEKTLIEISFSQYWKEIFVTAWRKSWDKWGMWGIIFPALASLLFAVITNWGKPLAVIFGENWILYVLIFVGLYILTTGYFVLKEPVTVHNKQQKDIQDLKTRLESRKAKIEIGEYYSPSYGQATKVGISIENKDESDLVPNVKIIGNVTQTKRYYTDVDIDPLNPDKDYRAIKLTEKEKIGFKGSGNIVFAEIQGDNIVLLLEKKLLLTSVKNVLDDEYFRWDLKFEIYGTINGGTFENGLYSTFIETKRTQHEIHLHIGEIKSLTDMDEN